MLGTGPWLTTFLIAYFLVATAFVIHDLTTFIRKHKQKRGN